MAELTNRFNAELGASIAGSILRTVTTARSVADPEITWTAAKIEKLLKPLREIEDAL